MLQLTGITKHFPGVTALENVSLVVTPGEVVALIGENGAGKSTLMKVLSGVHQPDEGTIQWEGQTVTFAMPSEALARGIRIIYQELSVLDNLDIAGNVFLGREPRRALGMMDRARMNDETATILERLKLKLTPQTPLANLSIAERQMVEIARALSMQVKLLILDEPTSSLTWEETERLLNLVADLRAQGVAILYITHRLEEVRRIADRVVALRDGKNAGALAKEEITHDAMVRLMVGREIVRVARTDKDFTPGEVRLELKEVRTQRYPQHAVSLNLRAGEIVGMAGLVGAGRSELARAVFGVDALVGGTVLVDNAPVRLRTPKDAIDAGVYLVPEDRRGAGLTVEMTIRENITLPALHQFATAGLVQADKEATAAASASQRLTVKAPSVETRAANLSGGNQQKVVIARWLALDPKVLIFDEPTRGIDVGAKAEIYTQMRALADLGIAIWMISSDMEEILNVSDRIVVLHEGKITGEIARADANEQILMQKMVEGS